MDVPVGNLQSFSVPITNGDLGSVLDYLLGPINMDSLLMESSPAPVEDFKHFVYSATPCHINSFLVKYKDILEKNMNATKDTPDYQKWCVEYCDLLMNIYGYDRSNMLIEIAKQNYVPAIDKLISYYWKKKNDKKAIEYFMKLAQIGNDAHCEYATKIYIENTDEQIQSDILKYFEILFNKNKNAKTCEWFMLLNVYIGNYTAATQIFVETKAVSDIKPIDMTKCYNSGLPNQVIYGEKNPFSKDDTTNKYINKLNPPWGKQYGKCTICMNDNMLLIPFDCTHQVCAQNCYPKIILDKLLCPQCRYHVNK